MPFLDEIPDAVAAEPVPDGQAAPRLSIPVDEIDGLQTQPVTRGEFDFASLSFSDEEAKALESKGRIGFFEQASRTKKLEKVPGIGLGAMVYESVAINNAIRRLQKDEYGGDKELQSRDIDTARKAIRYAGEEQLRGMTYWASFLEGTAQLPAYMIEFGASLFAGAPGANIAGRAVLRAGAKEITNQALKKAIFTGTKWATRAGIGATTVGVPRTVAQTFEAETALNLIPTDKGFELSRRMESKPVTSFMKAFGDTAIEYLSESAGSILFKPAFAKIGAAPVLSKAVEKVTELYKRLHPTQTFSKLLTKTGWDGFVEEIGEEVLGDQLRAVFNVSDFGVENGNVLDRMIAAIPDGDELAVMMGVLAVPGASNLAFQGGVTALDQYRKLKQGRGQTSTDAQARTLAGQIKQEGFDPVEAAAQEAVEPLPSIQPSQEALAGAKILKRPGEAQFDESKPVPPRAPLTEITSSREYKEADTERRMELLIRGRTADLDRQRTDIEDRMTRLETEIAGLKSIGRPDIAIIEGKQQELKDLSKALMSTHAQIADAIDATAEELSKEQVLLPGESLESLTKTARAVGAGMARREAERTFRNLRASAEERRTALVKYLKARLPGAENAKAREKYELRAAKNFTERQLQKYFAEIERLRETIRAKQLRTRLYELLDKMGSFIAEGNLKKGRFANASLQAIADTIVEVVKRGRKQTDEAAQSVQDMLEENQAKLAKLIDEGFGETDEAYLLRAQAEAIQQVGGINQRDADALEDSIRWATKKFNEFKVGRDTTLELRRLQNEAEKEAILADIAPAITDVKTFPQRVFQKVSQATQNLFSYTSFHLAEFFKEVSRGKKNSPLMKLVVDRLERLPLLRNALEIKIMRPFHQAMKDIYAMGQLKHADYVKFVGDRMSLEKTNSSETTPYDSDVEVELNNGTKRRIRMSRDRVMYWYALAHTAVGEEDTAAIEILTGETQLAAIRDEVEKQMVDADETDVDAAVATRAKTEIKGNAIPYSTLQEIFSTLTERDKQFAVKTREGFSATWGLINAIYRRAMGVNLDRTLAYIPWIRKPSAQQVLSDVLMAHSMVEGNVSSFPGFAKARRPNATAPFAEIGIFEVMDTYATTMSHWVASHEITARIQRLVKDADIRTAINKATDGREDKATGLWKDGEFMRRLEAHLKGIVSRGETDRVIMPAGFEAIRRNISRQSLASLKQFPLQATSFIAALQKIGHRDLMLGMLSFMRDPKTAFSLLKDGLSRYKRNESIQIELRELQDQVNKYGAAKRIGPVIIDRSFVDRYAYMPLVAGDISAVSLGGWAVFRAEYLKTKSVEKAYAAFDAFTISIMQSSVREQQTSATTGAGRIYFQFISALTQYARAYYRAWADLGKGNITVGEFGRIMMLYHFYIPAMRWIVANMFMPPPDDEEEEEKRRNRLLAEAVIGPMAGLWIMGDIANLAAHVMTGEPGFDSNPSVSTAINKTRKSVANAFRKALDEDTEMDELMDAVFKAEKQTTGLTVGMPAWLNNSVHGAYKVSSGDWVAADIPGVLYGHSVELLDFTKGDK